MIGQNAIRSRFGGPICRRCINETYRANLTPADCRYPYPFKNRCPCCGEQRNIVGSFRLSGQMKMLFKFGK
ncbi:MAG: hypothetical protein IIZ49_03545 [Oscillospiraceae bacterium]|nr:hypothetical protein [Oscillospiraceae bacterium]MBQ3879139.1 hypothetical protein [Oscillospiraceae bacterium]